MLSAGLPLKRWQSDYTCHHPHRFNELATKSERWNAKPRLTQMCQWSTSTFKNSCGCTALDMPEWREATEQIDWRAKQPPRVACFSEDLKCWEAWDTNCGQKAKDIIPSITWRREALCVERWSARRSSLKGREKAIVSRTTIGALAILKATLEGTSERRVGAYMGFSQRIDTILNWIELNWTKSLHYRFASQSYDTSTPNNRLRGMHHFWWQLGWKI